MRGNKSINTKPEVNLRKALLLAGLRGYRLNWEKALGCPDIVYPRRKVAIFVQGCFWHSCPYCKISLPKTHKRYWLKKLSNNKARDQFVQKVLKKEGWRVVVAWECQIKKNPNKVIDKIRNILRTNRGNIYTL